MADRPPQPNLSLACGCVVLLGLAGVLLYLFGQEVFPPPREMTITELEATTGLDLPRSAVLVSSSLQAGIRPDAQAEVTLARSDLRPFMRATGAKCTWEPATGEEVEAWLGVWKRGLAVRRGTWWMTDFSPPRSRPRRRWQQPIVVFDVAAFEPADPTRACTLYLRGSGN